MNIYTHKPTQITAIEYTEEWKQHFISLGVNPFENPFEVAIEGIPTAKLTFNWHTQKLHLCGNKSIFDHSIGEKEIKVGDYICRLEDSEKPVHFRLTKKMLEKYYTQNNQTNEKTNLLPIE